MNYFKHFPDTLNPLLTTSEVKIDGYTERDIQGYYSGTYCLQRVPGTDKLRPVLIRDVKLNDEGRYIATVYVLKDVKSEGYHLDTNVKKSTANLESLLRFMPVCGYLLLPTYSTPYYLTYGADKTYKKSCNASNLKFAPIGRPCSSVDTVFGLLALTGYLYPTVSTKNSTKVSPRICIHKEKVYTMFRNYTIGSYREGELHTPFSCVNERLQPRTENYL